MLSLFVSYNHFHVIMSAKRLSVSVKVKLNAIEKIKKGATQISIANELGVGASTVRGWLKEESKLRKFVENVEQTEGLSRKRARLANDDELDKALVLWFKEQRALGAPISGPIIKAKAKILAKKLKPNEEIDFEASDGWFWRWQKRHGIGQSIIHGEKRSADQDAALKFPAELKKKLDDLGLEDEQIYNADEAALYWKLLPNTTQDFKSSSMNCGFKKQKDRLTLLFAANKSGNHKLKLFLVGKSKNPRVLKNVNRDNLPVVYESSKNAWMTQTLFKKWFFDSFIPSVRLHLRNKSLEEKAVLLIDQCSAHPSEEELMSSDKKIKVMFLPPNTTSLLQPMDQGIIATFKKNYRRELLSNLLLGEERSLPGALKSVSLKDAMYISQNAWSAVRSETISKCWQKVLEDAEHEPDEENSAELLVQQSKSLGLNVDEDEITKWISIDDDEPISETLSDEQIIADVRGEEDLDNDDSDDEEETTSVSMKEAVDLLEKAYTAYEKCNSSYISAMQLINFRSLISAGKQVMREKAKQTTLDNFFSRK